MKIGRFSVETIPLDQNWGKNFYRFSSEKAVCGCIIVDASIFSFTWFDKECKCKICDQNICKCVCSVCQKTFPNCNCYPDAA